MFNYSIIILVIKMNFLEINKIFNKMIDNTRISMIEINLNALKNGLIIDKNEQ